MYIFLTKWWGILQLIQYFCRPIKVHWICNNITYLANQRVHGRGSTWSGSPRLSACSWSISKTRNLSHSSPNCFRLWYLLSLREEKNPVHRTGENLNTVKCGFDGGDCCECSCKVSVLHKLKNTSVHPVVNEHTQQILPFSLVHIIKRPCCLYISRTINYCFLFITGRAELSADRCTHDFSWQKPTSRQINAFFYSIRK